MGKRSWTDDELIRAVQENQSIASVLSQLNLSPLGQNYRTIKFHIKRLGISTIHMTGQAWRRGIPGSRGMGTEPTPLEKILVQNSLYNRAQLKSRIVRMGLIRYVCSICGCGDMWQGKKLVLVLDHVNGDPLDNRLENLRFLCSNCNSQTSTFAGRRLKKNWACILCGKPVSRAQTRCKKCASNLRIEVIEKRRLRPDMQTLRDEIWRYGFSGTGRRYGVTDNAIRKWCKVYGLPTTSRRRDGTAYMQVSKTCG